jgi:regulatory protein SWI5
MEETIKPMRGSRSNRNSGIFQDLRQQAEAMAQTPQRANTMPMNFTEQGLGTPGFMSMANVNAEFVKIENNFDGLPNGFPSDLSSDPSPMTPQMAAFGHGVFDHKPDFHPPSDFDSQSTMVPQQGHASSAAPSRRGSPHRRTESLASIASAASIASINIDETKTDTGVTIDDIAAYIEGPDPSDGKWICTFEKCLKRFGRKENIKSHVQTHLNDRQYQCPSCHKCFVRQHDLKRHAKIHTGIKPYPCECGNSFARHDALTRHRQRGMCIGAFDGIVRKVVKRGRPRKNRPDLDERREKSERTRRKNKHTSSSSVSSFSGYSDSSAVNSPCNNNNGFDGLMDDDNDPFPDIMDVAMGELPTTTATMNPTNFTVSSAPMPGPSNGPELVDITSPEHLAVSPSAISNYSHASHSSRAEPAQNSSELLSEYNLPTSSQHNSQNNPSSPAKSVASHYTHVPGTPPELSASSSPPPTGHGSRYFDLSDPHSDPNSSGLSEASSIGLGTTMAAHAAASLAGCGPLISNAGGAGMLGSMDDSDMSLLQFTTDEDGLVQIDHSGLGKFDDLEEYGNAVNLFTNDDVFFGST